MEIFIGLIIIAIGAFCQSSCYVPINKVKDWSWESFWLTQGVFAYVLFPLVGAFLAVPAGESLFALIGAHPQEAWLTLFFGMLWGVGGLTFGLSMRYLGVALGQSLALGTCAGLGVILPPFIKPLFGKALSESDHITVAVLVGVIVTLIGIAVIGIAGAMKSASLSEEEKREAVKDFNFPKGIAIALLAGFMSGCFAIGLSMGDNICFADSDPLFASLPATLVVTFGGFLVNAAYCLFQNQKNKTWGDYGKTSLYANNIFFCALAGLLWYSQFFGLSVGKGFLQESATLLAFSWCILMALNVTFSNVWGILLKEWKGCRQNVIVVLIVGLIILIASCFLPQLLREAGDVFLKVLV